MEGSHHRDAVDAAYAEHMIGLCRYLYSRGLPQDVIPDVVHDAFVVLLRRQAAVREGCTKSFLYGVASRLAQSYRRVHAARCAAEQECLPDIIHVFYGSCTELSSGSPIPDDSDGRCLASAVAALPDRLRLVITLLYLERRSRRDVARELGVTVRTVYNLRRRALAALRERMRDDASFLLHDE